MHSPSIVAWNRFSVPTANGHVAFCFQSSGYAFQDQPSTSRSDINREAPTPVWSLTLLPMFRLWFVWSPCIWTGPLLRAFVRSHVFLVDGALAWCCWREFFLLSELISMAYSAVFFLQSLSELLKFFFTASEQIDYIARPPVAKRSSSNWCWRQRGVSCFCLFYCIICRAVILRWTHMCRSLLPDLLQEFVK